MKPYVMILLLFLPVWIFIFMVVIAIATPFKLSIGFVLAIVVGIYELVARLVPTVSNWSLIGKIIDILKWLSEFFNRKK
jgi:hypothetical protein